MIHDERGAAYAEALISLPLLLMLFLGLFQYVYVCAADLIIERAASAAARAAVVFMPDDPNYYEDPSPEARQRYVAEAARRVLFAAGTFDPESVRVDLGSERGQFTPLTATVHAGFRCGVFLVRAFCGAERKLTLHASATLPYQQDVSH